jgi:hypothetical protein
VRKRYIAQGNTWVEITETPVSEGTMVMPDIQPYQSMVDGTMITSRSRHREHLRQHGVIEIGNEKLTPKPKSLPPGLKQRIIEIAAEKLRYK